MRAHRITLPELALIGGTRVLLGLGLGLLLSERLDSAQRRRVGVPLLAIGALSTIPLALRVLRDRPALDERQRKDTSHITVH
jgi:hypothetical protein